MHAIKKSELHLWSLPESRELTVSRTVHRCRAHVACIGRLVDLLRDAPLRYRSCKLFSVRSGERRADSIAIRVPVKRLYRRKSRPYCTPAVHLRIPRLVRPQRCLARYQRHSQGIGHLVPGIRAGRGGVALWRRAAKADPSGSSVLARRTSQVLAAPAGG